MTQSTQKAFKVSLVIHLAILVAMFLVPLIAQWFKSNKKKEQIMFVELAAPAAPAPAPAPAPPPPEPEPPKPEPVPEPPEPEPEPIPEPTPKPVKQEVKKPKEIKVNTNRIVRKEAPKPPPTPAKPRLTEEQLRQALSAGLPTSSSSARSSSTNPSELSSYYGTIQRIMYQAWDQPPAVAGLSTRVSIRIAKNGAIMQRNLLTGSGSQAMDDSVMKALRSISTFPRVPDGVDGAFLDVTITFESTGLSM